jgi:hypothetical protein
LASILKFVIFLCTLCQNINIFLAKKIFDWASIGGGTIFPRSPKTMRNGKKFGARSKKYFWFFVFMNPFYEPILVFLKFDPLAASEMALQNHLSRTNNEIVQNSNSEPKKFSILCTFKEAVS